MTASAKIDQILIDKGGSQRAWALFRASNGRLYSTSLDIAVGDFVELANTDDFPLVPIPYVVGGVYRDLLVSAVAPDGTPVDRLTYSVFDSKNNILFLEDADGFVRIPLVIDGRPEPFFVYDIKVVPRRVSGTAILELERQYGTNFDTDPDIGDRVQEAFGGGLYLSRATRQLYWSPADEVEGGGISSSALLLKVPTSVIKALTSKPEDLRLVSRSVALDGDGVENDAQIAMPVYRTVRGQTSLASISLYEVNGETGRFRSFSAARIPDLLAYEQLFRADFNLDTVIGELVDDAYGAGLYLGASSGSLYWSPSQESVGAAFSSEAVQVKAPASVIQALKNKPEDLSLVGRDTVFNADGQIREVQVALPVFRLVKGEKRLSALQIYTIDVSSGQLKSLSVANTADILAYEQLFGEDFSGDGVKGDQVETGFGGGLYRGVFTQALYWSPSPERDDVAFSAEAIQLKAPSSLMTALQKAKASGIVPATRLFAMDVDSVANDLQIALPSYRTVSGKSTVSLMIYELNLESGRLKTMQASMSSDIRRYESAFQMNFDDDPVIGDPVKKDLGAGLYRVDSGSFYWSAQPELEGQPISASATPLKANPRLLHGMEAAVDSLTGLGLSDLGPVTRPVALDRDFIRNDVQIVVPSYRELPNGDIRFASLLVYEINPATAILKSRAVTSVMAVNELEKAFDLDFNSDGLMAGVDPFAL